VQDALPPKAVMCRTEAGLACLALHDMGTAGDTESPPRSLCSASPTCTVLWAAVRRSASRSASGA
jgi:hypothetical protein